MKEKNAKNKEEFANVMVELERQTFAKLIDIGFEYNVCISDLIDIFGGHLKDVAKKINKEFDANHWVEEGGAK